METEPPVPISRKGSNLGPSVSTRSREGTPAIDPILDWCDYRKGGVWWVGSVILVQGNKPTTWESTLVRIQLGPSDGKGVCSPKKSPSLQTGQTFIVHNASRSERSCFVCTRTKVYRQKSKGT